VLILDDPKDTQARDAIDILDKNSGNSGTRSSSSLSISSRPRNSSWSRSAARGATILTAKLRSYRSRSALERRAGAARAFRRRLDQDAATAKWASIPHTTFRNSGRLRLERLSRALDGNPLMLAEAAVWLRRARRAAGPIARSLRC